MEKISSLKAKVKGNGSIVKGKLAEVFIKIGIAEKIEDTPDAWKEKPINAKQTAELITECETVKDLKEYETDTRQVVKAAFNKRLKELK